MKCIKCLSEDVDNNADVICCGYSFCTEHAIEYMNNQNKNFDKFDKKIKQQNKKLREQHKRMKELTTSIRDLE